MAESTKLFQSATHNIFGNFLYDVLRTICGGTVVAVGVGAWAYIKGRPLDWWGLLALGVFTSAVLGFLLWLRKPQGAGVAVAAQPPDGDDDPNQALRNSVENYNLNFYYKTGFQAAHLFTPLQMEAFQIAKDVGVMLSRMPKEPQNEGSVTDEQTIKQFIEPWKRYQEEEAKIRAEYAHSAAAKVKGVVLRLQMEGVREDEYMGYYFDQVPNVRHLRYVREKLVAMAFEVDGIQYLVDTQGMFI